MSLHKVSAALVNAYRSVMPLLPTSYEGMPFDPPKDGPWAEVDNNPADIRVRTLGEDGEDNYTGFFQIDTHQPRNLGSRYLNDKAWVLLSAFQAGTRLWYDGQEVVVRRSVPTKIRADDNHADNVITVTVYWDARFRRDGSVAIPPPGGPTTPGYGAEGTGEQDYEFIQASPSALWVINHNLGRLVTTDVYTSGGVKVWADVRNISNNITHVVLDTPMSGYAIIN